MKYDDANMQKYSIKIIPPFESVIIDAIQRRKKIDFEAYSEVFKNQLFLKREAFKYEKEVRFVCLIEEQKYSTKKVLHLEVNAKSFIEEIVFDPRMPQDVYKIYKTVLVEMIGVPNSTVHRSDLYDFDIESLLGGL